MDGASRATSIAPRDRQLFFVRVGNQLGVFTMGGPRTSFSQLRVLRDSRLHGQMTVQKGWIVGERASSHPRPPRRQKTHRISQTAVHDLPGRTGPHHREAAAVECRGARGADALLTSGDEHWPIATSAARHGLKYTATGRRYPYPTLTMSTAVQSARAAGVRRYLRAGRGGCRRDS